jgi:alkylation response protein AidB-like acyl-CoA dehydrogenase
VRFAFREEQILFQRAVREFLEKECPAEHVRAMEHHPTGRSRELWKGLAQLGVVGLTVPKEHGGLGLDEVGLVLLLEEAGRAALPEPLLETTAVAAPLLADVGTEELRDRWLPAVVAGDAVLTVGLAANGYVADTHIADLLVMQDGEDIHAVPRDRVDGTDAQQSLDGTRRLYGVRWTPTSETFVTRNRLALQEAFDRGALGAAAELLGVAGRVIEMAATYAKERHQFGKPIGSFQAVKHHLASALVALEFARPAVYRAAWSVARRVGERGRDVSMAKALASDAATLACRTALQVHGAIGYTYEHDLHLWLKRGFSLASAWGDAARHRTRVAHAIL